MPATTKPEARDANTTRSVEEVMTATPDEAGPHDVPDEEVIEKTLPAGTAPDPGRKERA
jgi:hypothetical protein